MVPIAKALAAVIAAIATPAMGAPSHAIARAGAAATLLDKPTVNPPVTNLDEYLLRQLMYAKPEITPWACDLGKPNGCFVSTYCKDIFLKENHSLKYIDMFDVMYEDCDRPWMMCQHKTAPFQRNVTAEYFARIPVGMRKWVRHVVALPADNHGGSDAIYDGDNIIIKGYPSLHDIIAAVARAVAVHGYARYGPFWKTYEWEEAYNLDSAVLNSFSQQSQEENLKQMTVLSLYGAQNPNLVSNRVPEFHKVINMYNAIQGAARENTFTVVKGWNCPERLMDSDVEPLET